MNASTTTFVSSRTLDAPVDEAAAGIDRLRQDRGGEITITGERGVLTLGDELSIDATPGDVLTRYVPVRRYDATLQIGPLRRVAVELELLPWSDDRTEVLLRPARVQHSRAYFTEAESVLRRLAEQVERRVRLTDLVAA